MLAEVAPERIDAILARGLEFGQSRVICGVYWKCDIHACLKSLLDFAAEAQALELSKK